jgi:hypothetical protein
MHDIQEIHSKAKGNDYVNTILQPTFMWCQDLKPNRYEMVESEASDQLGSAGLTTKSGKL